MKKLRFALQALVVVVTAALVSLVAACSAPADDSSTDSSTDSSVAYTPVTIDHQYGTTSIEHRPQRVISLASNWTDTLAALDIPITAQFAEQGYSGPNNRFAWTPEHDSEVEIVGSMAALDISKVAAYKPDLILAGYTGGQKNYDRLSALAPTIPVMKKGATVDTWEDITQATGTMFGKNAAADDLVDGTNDKITRFRSDHPNAAGKTFTFAQFQPTGDVGAINSVEDPAAGLLAQLGFTLNPKLAAEHTGTVTRSRISSERIDLLDSDLLVAWTLGDDSAYQKVSGWNGLTAVENDTVVYLTNDNAPAFGVPSAPSVGYVIDLLNPVAQRL
ncbi:ABC transporter substrate-binding protein [Gordonia sp. SL306]|uniref:ABC transporter substrate-binding protein n=1 Tax=Gordonia sp. SL306 TaxID=2995145 RepID=UPI0022705F99|nr:ABC transporter substrate-binding protein [Gordonia sp. SL306]WAC55383.1 ABC transporter substrate-binding protein [Gordonia sp. SL306]